MLNRQWFIKEHTVDLKICWVETKQKRFIIFLLTVHNILIHWGVDYISVVMESKFCVMKGLEFIEQELNIGMIFKKRQSVWVPDL